MRIITALFSGCLLSTTVLVATPGWAGNDKHPITYKIIITNLTPGQPVAPVLATTHSAGLSFFAPGAAPNTELAALAEAGDGNPMAALLLTQPGFRDAQVGPGPTLPGQSATMTVQARSHHDHLSIGAMLGNTNDAFIALRDVALPKGYGAMTYYADAYDAGSETNDESCSTVPGPACGGAALSPGDAGEGFVHIHSGVHGIGGLLPSQHDWRNPAAQVVIMRVKK